MATYNNSQSEDTVKYMLFPSIRSKNKNNVGHDNLELYAENYISKLSSLLSRYIWQNESFNLRPVVSASDVPAHLYGETNYGDNIEDEWFIVFILFYLSKEDPDLVIKVEDNDGDFLLIEAADYLPEWLNPETSTNRVFIYQGSLHIIPIAQSPSEITPIPSGTPSISDAISAIKQNTSVTMASLEVQHAVRNRIDGYPDKIESFHHRAHCYVPASVAAILKEEPWLLSAAVRAFYLRDPLDMKACRAMRFFAPETRVMTEVVFTKCLYAQLVSQEYEPDKRTGWNLPGVNDPLYKAHSLGMKLACGFEILAANVQKSKSESEDLDGNEVTDVDFNNDSKWKRFIRSLNQSGYFRGELEGSKLYQQLLSQAKSFYLSSLKSHCHDHSPAIQVLRLLERLTINYEEMKAASNNLAPADDDSWMEITPEELDSTLEQIANRNSKSSSAATDVADQITSTLKSFLSHTSDMEGAELPRENKKKKQKVQLDAETFCDAVNNILDFRVPNSDDDASSSSMSGYSDDEEEDAKYDEGDARVSKRLDKDQMSKEKAKEVMDEMRSYMEQMDRELAGTEVGKSFELEQPQPKNKEKTMDGSDSEDINDEDDDFRPVDVNLTALKNILESYSSQSGLPGPASNLFNSLGMALPDDSDS